MGHGRPKRTAAVISLCRDWLLYWAYSLIIETILVNILRGKSSTYNFFIFLFCIFRNNMLHRQNQSWKASAVKKKQWKTKMNDWNQIIRCAYSFSGRSDSVETVAYRLYFVLTHFAPNDDISKIFYTPRDRWKGFTGNFCRKYFNKPIKEKRKRKENERRIAA